MSDNCNKLCKINPLIVHSDRPADANHLRQQEADSDPKVIALWLHGRSEHTQRAYGADVARLSLNCGEFKGPVTLNEIPIRPRRFFAPVRSPRIGIAAGSWFKAFTGTIVPRTEILWSPRSIRPLAVARKLSAVILARSIWIKSSCRLNGIVKRETASDRPLCRIRKFDILISPCARLSSVFSTRITICPP